MKRNRFSSKKTNFLHALDAACQHDFEVRLQVTIYIYSDDHHATSMVTAPGDIVSPFRACQLNITNILYIIHNTHMIAHAGYGRKIMGSMKRYGRERVV